MSVSAQALHESNRRRALRGEWPLHVGDEIELLQSLLQLLQLSVRPFMFSQSFPERLHGQVQTRDAHQLVDEKWLFLHRISQPQHKHHISECIIDASDRQLCRSLPFQFLDDAFDARQMWQKDRKWIVEFVINRIPNVWSFGCGAQFIERGLVNFQMFQDSHRSIGSFLRWLSWNI